MVRTPFEVPAGIRPAYEKWFTFMMESVDFALKISPIHTKEHASRVLLFALLMAEQMELPPKDWEILGAAAAFHDTRRQDDWLDVGHGKRAARYYHAYCRGRGLPYYRLTAAIMTYHDHDDALGDAVIGHRFGQRGVLLYHIFKDADALDRFRLGPGGFDPAYLRTAAGKAMYDYAKGIWDQVCRAKKE